MKILVNIDVPDLEQGIRFYTSAFGLRLTRRLDEDVAELEGGSSTIYLLAKPTGSASAGTGSEPRDYARHWTPVHVDFVVDDLDAAVRQAIDAGARQETDCVAWRGSQCITFSDPFGHGFCLIHFEEGTYR